MAGPERTAAMARRGPMLLVAGAERRRGGNFETPIVGKFVARTGGRIDANTQVAGEMPELLFDGLRRMDDKTVTHRKNRHIADNMRYDRCTPHHYSSLHTHES